MGRDDGEFMRDVKILQHLAGGFHDFAVGGASHDDADLGWHGVKVHLAGFALAGAVCAGAASRYLTIEPVAPSPGHKPQKIRQPSAAGMRESFYDRITKSIDLAITDEKS